MEEIGVDGLTRKQRTEKWIFIFQAASDQTDDPLLKDVLKAQIEDLRMQLLEMDTTVPRLQ